MTQEFQKQLETILHTAQNIFQVIATFLVAFLVVLWLTLCLWTFRDIQSRTRDFIAQIFATLLVLFFNIPGVLLYILVRPKETLAQAYERSLQEEYMLQDLEEREICPTCRVKTQPDFMFCFNCRTRLRRECNNCNQLIKIKWANCPFCGTAQKVRPHEGVADRAGLGAPRAPVPGPAHPGETALATMGNPPVAQELNAYQAYTQPSVPRPRPQPTPPPTSYADAGETYVPETQPGYSYQPGSRYTQPIRSNMTDAGLTQEIAPELIADADTSEQYKPPRQRRTRNGRTPGSPNQDE
jgi:hypothetical protein